MIKINRNIIDAVHKTHAVHNDHALNDWCWFMCTHSHMRNGVCFYNEMEINSGKNCKRCPYQHKRITVERQIKKHIWLRDVALKVLDSTVGIIARNIEAMSKKIIKK